MSLLRDTLNIAHAHLQARRLGFKGRCAYSLRKTNFLSWSRVVDRHEVALGYDIDRREWRCSASPLTYPRWNGSFWARGARASDAYADVMTQIRGIE